MQKNEIEVRDYREKGWFFVDNVFIDRYSKIFGVNGSAIYFSLCRHSDNKTGKCYPSMALIGQELGITRQTVAKYVTLLEQYNLIKIEAIFDEKTKKRLNNVYTLTTKEVWLQEPCKADEHGNEKAMLTPLTSTPENKEKSHVNEVNKKETQYNTNTNTRRLIGGDEFFETFWNNYPKRENKKGCLDKWKTKRLDDKINKIITFIEQAKKTDRWIQGFIVAPLVFLNQERWEDDLDSYKDIKKSTNKTINL